MPTERVPYKLGIDEISPAATGEGGDLLLDNDKQLADLIEDLQAEIEGLPVVDESQFALLGGRSGGQTLTGGTASGEDLTLRSTSNGTTGDIVVGSSFTVNEATGNVSANQITSTVTTGTAPLVVTSTTNVTNLNADQLDGAHASATPTASHIPIADGSNKLAAGWITEVLAITDLSDVASKTGSGTAVVMGTSPTLTASGGVSLNAGSGRITNVSDPSSSQDAATKAYTDTKQTADDTLTALAAVTTAANKLIYATGSDAFSTTDLTTFGRTLIATSDASGGRTALELGTAALVADSSLAHLAGAETFTGQKVFLTGATGTAPTIFRQTGGTAGTDELQVSHNGQDATIENKDRSITIRGNANGTTISLVARDRTYSFSDGSNVGFINPTNTEHFGSCRYASTSLVGFSSNATPYAAAADVGIARDSSGVLRITNGSTGYGAVVVPDLSSASALVLRSAATGLLTLRPGFSTSAWIVLSDANYSGSGTHYAAKAVTGTISKSSGTFIGLSIQPTYAASGSSAATDLLINRTETSVGSGLQKHIDIQVAGTPRAYIQSSSTNATLTSATNFGLIVRGGTGTNADVELPDPQDGGDGSTVSIIGGTGGFESNGGTAGDGGSVKIQAGSAGANESGGAGNYGEVVVNDDGALTNFRVESDGNANMIFVDAGNNRVGVGKSNPATALDVNGTATATLFSGSGASITSLSASNISSGTLDSARLDATLTALAGVSTSANTLIYATGSDTFTTTSLTSFGRSLIDDADSTAGRSTLGLGTSATVNTGTSGATIPLLNAVNTWSASQTMTASSSSAIPLILKGASGQSANLLEIQNSSSQVTNWWDDDGSMYIWTTNSTTSSPKKMGMFGLSTGEAARWIFGDDLNAVQCANGRKMAVGGYWGLDLYGGHFGFGTFSPPPFNSHNSTGVSVINVADTFTALAVIGASTQSADLFQCRDSSGNVLLGVDANGVIKMRPVSSTPSNPASGSAHKYLKGGKEITQYNDSGTVRYTWLDLTTGSVGHSTTAP